MPCSSGDNGHPSQYLTEYLCSACKLLTREQLKEILGGHEVNLLTWYGGHLENDYVSNLKNNPSESAAALLELNRLGYTLKRLEPILGGVERSIYQIVPLTIT